MYVSSGTHTHVHSMSYMEDGGFLVFIMKHNFCNKKSLFSDIIMASWIVIHQPMQDHIIFRTYTLVQPCMYFFDAGTEFSHFLLPLRRTTGGQTEEATAEGKILVRRFAS